MTHRRNSNAKYAESALGDVDEILDLLQTADNPFAPMLSFLINRAMIFERTKHLCAGRHERTDGCKGYTNGYKDRSLKTRLGKLELKVPQVRDSDEPFYPESLHAAMMSETALRVALAEMYVHGVATCKVKGVFEKLCGFGVSAMEVSRAAKDLDDVLDVWRSRRLGVIPFLQLDALRCKVRQLGLAAGYSGADCGWSSGGWKANNPRSNGGDW